jgi:hypothetical protein
VEGAFEFYLYAYVCADLPDVHVQKRRRRKKKVTCTFFVVICGVYSTLFLVVNETREL